MYFNPNGMCTLAFFGLLFPAILLINIIFFLFWIFARFKYAAFSFIAILLSFPAMKNYFAFASASEEKTKAIRVMSYNVRNFDLYNWKQGATTMKKIMVLLKEQDPDIMCLQEFFNADTGRFQTIKKLLEQNGYKYYEFEKTVERDHYGAWGVATFSHYPILNTGSLRFHNSKLNSSLFTDISIDSTVVRVYNVHLQSVYLSSGDYEYIEHVTADQDVQLKPTQQILSKLKSAFQSRAVQSVELKKQIGDSPYPVLVCGDFNDTPSSFCYETLSRNLNDAFLCASSGIGPTYSGVLSPFRIDYILTDKKFSVVAYKSICEKLSDHYPVTCSITLPKKK